MNEIALEKMQSLKLQCVKNIFGGAYTARAVLKIISFFEEKLEESEKEKSLILRQIERSLGEQHDVRPEIPLEVAEGIIIARAKGHSNVDIVHTAFQLQPEAKFYEPIRDFAADNFDTFLKALVIGYRTEQLTEKELERRQIRLWYHAALDRAEKGDDWPKEVIEEIVLYLGGGEMIADLSSFVRNQLARQKQSG